MRPRGALDAWDFRMGGLRGRLDLGGLGIVLRRLLGEVWLVAVNGHASGRSGRFLTDKVACGGPPFLRAGLSLRKNIRDPRLMHSCIQSYHPNN